MSTEINHKKSAVTQFMDDNSASPALVVLKSLSEAIPKENKVDITLYQYNTVVTGGGKLVLKGETDGYASVAAIVEAVKKMQTLKNVEEKQSGAKPGTDNKVIEFTIHADYAGAVNNGGKA